MRTEQTPNILANIAAVVAGHNAVVFVLATNLRLPTMTTSKFMSSQAFQKVQDLEDPTDLSVHWRKKWSM